MKFNQAVLPVLCAILTSASLSFAEEVVCPNKVGLPINLSGNYLACDANFGDAVDGLIDAMKRPNLACNKKKCDGVAYWGLSFTKNDVKKLDEGSASKCDDYSPLKDSSGSEISEEECRSKIRGTSTAPRRCWFLEVSGTKADHWECRPKGGLDIIVTDLDDMVAAGLISPEEAFAIIRNYSMETAQQ